MNTSQTLILLAEDDLNLGLLTQDLLRSSGHTVHLTRDGKEALNQFNVNPYNLCILDVMMPKKDGFSLAEDIRKINSTVPIIFLTAREMVEDKIQGFKVGADDYITKPFDSEEFLLRVSAVLKRSDKSGYRQPASTTLTIGVFRFNPEKYELIGPDGAKTLTKKESELLKALAMRKGQPVERELLANLVWGDDNYFVGRSMDVFITKLRKYFQGDPNVKITNLHGIGFKLED